MESFKAPSLSLSLSLPGPAFLAGKVTVLSDTGHVASCSVRPKMSPFQDKVCSVSSFKMKLLELFPDTLSQIFDESRNLQLIDQTRSLDVWEPLT